MAKKAVIIYGPPGSGKGTQAELLAKIGYFLHFDTGRFIESLLRSPEAKKSAVLRREKKLFETGKLCTPSWVLKVVREESKAVAAADMSIAFSGSPRTLYEAFGDGKQEGLLKTLEKAYGKKNITIVILDVSHKSSMQRNGARFVCSLCGLPRLAHAKNTHCSFCDSTFRRRVLDDPKVIPERLKEYEERTFPIIAKAKKAGYIIRKVDGEKRPYEVFASVRKIIGV